MNSGTKILLGAVMTVILSVCVHSFVGVGASFVDDLEVKAIRKVSDARLHFIDVSFIREPAIKRVAVLSGDVPKVARQQALDTVKSIPGVSDAYWDDVTPNAVNVGSADGLSADKESTNSKTSEALAIDTPEITGTPQEIAEKAAQCQNDINALMAKKDINFRSGSFYISPSNLRLIDEIAATFKPCTSMHMEIQGHTDLIGNAIVNESISQARADEVMKSLIERGLDANNISAKGYGASQPIVDARTSAANAKNRRTKFVITGSKK